jgi:hypothetical protein
MFPSQEVFHSLSIFITTIASFVSGIQPGFWDH